MSDLRVDVSGVLAGLDAWAQRLRERIEGAAGEIAHVLEQYAINNHPWQIDTGETNETTEGRVREFSRDLCLITLSAGMDYDVFLELAGAGKWSWLWPAVQANIDAIREILVTRLRG